MTDQALILSSLVSIILGIGVVFLFAFGAIKIKSWWTRAITASFLYALFFGLGILGGGNETGFALPVPIIPTFIFSDEGVRFYSAIIPFLCWWTLFFASQIVRRIYKQMVQKRKV